MNQYLNRYLGQFLSTFIEHFLKDKIRRGSIQAVKGYIQTVRFVRLGILGLFAIGAISAILVSGIVLMIVGIVSLLPLVPVAASVTLIVIGAIFTLVTGVALTVAFSQKRWLEMSKSYELMDAVLAPWPGPYPPNPLDIFAGRAPAAPSTSSAPGSQLPNPAL